MGPLKVRRRTIPAASCSSAVRARGPGAMTVPPVVSFYRAEGIGGTAQLVAYHLFGVARKPVEGSRHIGAQAQQ